MAEGYKDTFNYFAGFLGYIFSRAHRKSLNWQQKSIIGMIFNK